MGFGTERPGLEGCVTLGKTHHHFLANMRWLGEPWKPMSFSPKVPLLLLLSQGSLLSCVHTCLHVLTCTCVVVQLSLKGRMENEITYLSLGLGKSPVYSLEHYILDLLPPVSQWLSALPHRIYVNESIF